ncbi:hypothetical protein BsWGS_02299 [Bradybaena similaris]
MASFYKSLFKSNPKAEGKQAQGRVKVNAIGQNSISLLLPTSSWQTIIQLLTTENQRLQKQIQCFLQYDKPVRTPQVDLTKKATQNARSCRWLKQPVRRVKKQEKQFSCQSCVEVPSRVVSTWPYQRRELSPPSQRQEIFRQDVSTTLPSSVAEEQLTRSTGSASQNQKNFCGVSRASQTDPEKEDRGVNTKLNFKQPKVLPPTSTTQPKRSSLDINSPTRQSCPKVESEHQQTELIQLVKPVEQELKRRVTKGPPEVRQCFYCHSESHQIKSCELYQQKKSRRRGNNTRKVVQVSQGINNRVGCKENRTDEQRIVIKSSANKDKVQTTPTNKTPMSSIRDTALKTSTNNILKKAPEPSVSLSNCTTPQIKVKSVQLTQKTVPATVKAEVVHSVNVSPTLQDKAQLILTVPENAQQLISYAQRMFDNLISKNEIYLPEQKSEFCVYCRTVSHNVSDCLKFRVDSEKYFIEDDNRCSVCAEEHKMVTCEWMPLLDRAHSLTVENQEKLLKVCPFLRNFIENPDDSIFFSCAWLNIREMLAKIDPALFGMTTNPA